MYLTFYIMLCNSGGCLNIAPISPSLITDLHCIIFSCLVNRSVLRLEVRTEQPLVALLAFRISWPPQPHASEPVTSSTPAFYVLPLSPSYKRPHRFILMARCSKDWQATIPRTIPMKTRAECKISQKESQIDI